MEHGGITGDGHADELLRCDAGGGDCLVQERGDGFVGDGILELGEPGVVFGAECDSGDDIVAEVHLLVEGSGFCEDSPVEQVEEEDDDGGGADVDSRSDGPRQGCGGVRLVEGAMRIGYSDSEVSEDEGLMGDQGAGRQA